MNTKLKFAFLCTVALATLAFQLIGPFRSLAIAIPIVTASTKNDVLSARTALKTACQRRTWASRIAEEGPYRSLCRELFPEMLEQQSPPFVTPTRCRLLVIAAGMQRSGSTLQAVLAAKALEFLGVKEYSVAYWNYFLHNMANLTRDDMLKHHDRQQRLIRSMNNDTNAIAIFKTHQYDPILLGFCRNQLLLTTHRDLRHTVASIQNAAWASNEKEMADIIDENVGNYECWKMHGPIDVEYGQFGMDQEKNGLIVLSSVAAALGMEHRLNFTQWLEIVGHYKRNDANPSIPGGLFRTKQGVEEVPTSFSVAAGASVFNKRHWEWMRDQGYSPALHA